MLKKLIHFTSENFPDTFKDTKTLRMLLEKPEFSHIELDHYDIENSEAQLLIMKYGVKGVPCTVFLDEKDEFLLKTTGTMGEVNYVTYLNFNTYGTK